MSVAAPRQGPGSSPGRGSGAPRDTALARFRAGYGRVLEWLVALLMVVLACEVTLGIVYRALGAALIWYDEIASHLLAWLTFYGAALASVKRAHIGCPEVVAMMPWRARRAVNIGVQLLVIAFFALLGFIGVQIMPVLATDALVSVPEVPMSIVQSVIPIASALILIAEIAYLIELVQAREPIAPEGAPGLADALH
jgi:TRAP-type C4-dicarboxylate transport system permease small subunit